MIKSYRNLEIYSLSHDLAIEIHKMTLKLPGYELHEEGSQLRRSSKGIVSCVVEGYGRRRYKAEFIRFLIYAHASCDETIEHLRIIGKTHDMLRGEAEDLVSQFDLLGSKINRFLKFVEGNWKQGGKNNETA